MPLQSYLVRPFDTTNENKYFRQFHSMLSEHLKECQGSCILVGNLSVNGRALDAVFMKDGAIIVIDFKNYSGEVEFSENGPWKLKTPEGDMLFVQGGAQNRNPYQQVKEYRDGLFRHLAAYADEILDENHVDVDWAHTSCVVLFHEDIRMDESRIPKKIGMYLTVTDTRRILHEIEDRNSAKLKFSDAELENILQVLGIRAEHLYVATDVDMSKSLVSKKEDIVRLERIRQLVPSLEKDTSPEQRAIAFYKTMIAIERINDVKVEDVHFYPIDWPNIDSKSYSLDIESNENFHNLYRKNKEERFPKNLFVSVNVFFMGKRVPFLYTIILVSDIENQKEVRISFDEFSVYKPALSELHLTDDYLAELDAVVAERGDLLDKLEKARDFLDTTIELLPNISLSLSKESPFTKQLDSELNTLLKGKEEMSTGTVLNSFLSAKASIVKDEGEELDFVSITALNNEQIEAVRRSFSQKLTIITGPPGTGKTQVVTNILANAVYHNQKVLFASKNGQAVDTVQERTNASLDTDYFLRVGSKGYNSKPVEFLASIISQIRNGKFLDVAIEQQEYRSALEKLIEEEKLHQKKLAEIPVLKAALHEKKDHLEQVKGEEQLWIAGLDKRRHAFYVESGIEVAGSKSELNRLLGRLPRKGGGGFAQFWFNLFYKSKIEKAIVKIHSGEDSHLQQYLDENFPYFSETKKISESFRDYLEALKKESEVQKSIRRTKENYVKDRKDLEAKISSLENSLSLILDAEPGLRLRIAEIHEESIPLSIELIKATISEKLRNANVRDIDVYKGFLENGMPWKYDEVGIAKRDILKFLEIFNVMSTTSLSVKNNLLMDEGMFDILVIDEASQCDIASALPLMYRAKRVVIIGDPMQLTHITSVKKHEQAFVRELLEMSHTEFNYIDQSLFNKADSISNREMFDSVFLSKHYRCHPAIVGFSNAYFYERSGKGLEVQTKADQFQFGDNSGWKWVNVYGEVEKTRNVNHEEARKAVLLAKELTAKYPNASIGLVSIFKHQKEEMMRLLAQSQLNDVVCDTVHRFQGDEKDIIVLSLVVAPNSKASLVNFINERQKHLINVAVTRARSSLYIVGNRDYCLSLNRNRQPTLLAELANWDNLAN